MGHLEREEAMTRILMLSLALFLTGCGMHYWQAADRGVTEFGTDSGQCIQESKSKYIVSEQIYRACMRTRGWERVQTQYPTNRQFRGPEDEDEFATPPDPLSARGIQPSIEQPVAAPPSPLGERGIQPSMIEQPVDCRNQAASPSPAQRARCK
jgi:hypothetical protein